MKDSPHQAARLVILLLYVGVLLLANIVAFNSLVPPSGKDLWFYAGLASLILGDLLLTPYFTKPVDAISNGIAGALAIFVSMSSSQLAIDEKAIAYFAAIVCVLVIVMGFLCIATKDSSHDPVHRLSDTLRVLADRFGNHRVVFSVVIIYALLLFHRSNANEILVIGLVWISILAKPADYLWNMVAKLKGIWFVQRQSKVIAKIEAHQMPSTILLNKTTPDQVPFGTLIGIKTNSQALQLGITLDNIGLTNQGTFLRAIEVDTPITIREQVQVYNHSLTDGDVVDIDDKDLIKTINEIQPLSSMLNDLVGIVAPDTSVERLYFDIVRTSDIELGSLVEVLINGRSVLYQVVDGLTKEEVVQQHNTHGYARAQARKIGEWQKDQRRFVPSRWLPTMNAPVVLMSSTTSSPKDRECIGHFPKTEYGIELKKINEMVTHNVAILGILGIGKSMLAMELIERMVGEGIKVICLDPTNQYIEGLSDLMDKSLLDADIEKLKCATSNGKTIVKQNVEEGGSLRQFQKCLSEVLDGFLGPNCAEKLRIFNPVSFEIWRQDSRPYNNTASMASLTPAEVTRIFSEVVLQSVQKMGMTDCARVCLVYEEAHSLVPEWNSVSAEADKTASIGSAKAILQGRKYGLGCLVVTQRTANVAKTLLNQCNTIFAMRSFDDTAKDFLSNFIGNDYADMLPSLSERHAIFYGRASSCENPIYIRLNDREDFLRVFRDTNISASDNTKIEC